MVGVGERAARGTSGAHPGAGVPEVVEVEPARQDRPTVNDKGTVVAIDIGKGAYARCYASMPFN